MYLVSVTWIYVFLSNLLCSRCLSLVSITTISNVRKQLQGLEEERQAKIHLNLLRATLKKVPNWKTPGQYVIHGYWLKNSLPSMTDWLSKGIDIYNPPQTYPNGWPPKSKKTPKKEPRQQLQTLNVPTNMWKILRAQGRFTIR